MAIWIIPFGQIHASSCFHFFKKQLHNQERISIILDIKAICKFTLFTFQIVDIAVREVNMGFVVGGLAVVHQVDDLQQAMRL
jgi:hypothetical protein